MTSLLVSNMTKTDGGATRLKMKLIGLESCGDVGTWCTGAFWFGFGKGTLTSIISKLDVTIVGKLKNVDITLVMFARRVLSK